MTPQTATAPQAVPRVSTLDDYIPILGKAEISELRTLASRLGKRSVQMVNSTAVGGGVAEMLNRIVPLMQELEISVRWDVITGGEDFFAVTKAFHNALHGGRRPRKRVVALDVALPHRPLAAEREGLEVHGAIRCQI
jgi:hypothetical protein